MKLSHLPFLLAATTLASFVGGEYNTNEINQVANRQAEDLMEIRNRSIHDCANSSSIPDILSRKLDLEISIAPSAVLSTAPTLHGSSTPTIDGSSKPTIGGSSAPSSSPSSEPSLRPATSAPSSSAPTLAPSIAPTSLPTNEPTLEGSSAPSINGSTLPSSSPSLPPSKRPTSKATTNSPAFEEFSTVTPTTSPTSRTLGNTPTPTTDMPSIAVLSTPLSEETSTPTINTSSAPSSQESTTLSSTLSPSLVSERTFRPTQAPSGLPTTTTNSPSLFTLRINAGSTEDGYDSSGKHWMADTYFTYGWRATKGDGVVSNADPKDEFIYRSARHAGSQGLKYNIPVPNGDYVVALHFMEFWHVDRTINLNVESLSVRNFDSVKEAQGKMIAYSKAFNVIVEDGMLNIDFVKVGREGMVNGIEIVQYVETPEPTQSPSITSKATIPPSVFALRINAGSTEGGYDSAGRYWAADTYFTYGWRASKGDGVVSNADLKDEFIYRSARHAGSQGLKYNIPVPNGDYLVTLHFMEFWHVDRMVDLHVESLSVENFDSVKEAKGTMVAYSKLFKVLVEDGMLNIDFVKVGREGMVNGIEIVQYVETPDPTQAPSISPKVSIPPSLFALRINTGSTEGGYDSAGRYWMADTYFTYGWRASKGDGVVSNADPRDEFIYRSARHAGSQGLKYNIPVPNGDYVVTLHFMEFWHVARVIDLHVEASSVENFDSVKEAKGKMVAYSKEFNVHVNDGILNIDFVQVGREGMVNGIEILQYVETPEPTQAPSVSSKVTIPPSSFALRINAGSTENGYDSAGRYWMADTYFTYGWRASKGDGIMSNANPKDEFIYRSARHAGGKGLKYDIPVPNGEYVVTLHFMEFWHVDRMIDLHVESLFVENFDSVKEAQGKMVAFSKAFQVLVEDGLLNIDFVQVGREGMVNGIEIVEFQATPEPTQAPIASSNETTTSMPSSAAKVVFKTFPGLVALTDETAEPTQAPSASPTVTIPPSTYALRINAGSTEDGYDSAGNYWRPDTYFTYGWRASKGDGVISNADPKDEFIYRSARHAGGQGLKYDIPVPNGEYLVTLHFMEFWHLDRLIDLSIENLSVESFDSVKEARGKMVAFLKTFKVIVEDAMVNINFVKVGREAMVNGIEVVQYVETPEPTQAPTVTFSPTSAPSEFGIRINVGSNKGFHDSLDRYWMPDTYNRRGWTASKFNEDVYDTNPIDAELYRYARFGDNFEYVIPLEPGSYEIKLHFMEFFRTTVGGRVFNLQVENTLLEDFDTIRIGKERLRAFTVEFVEIVDDGFLNIQIAPSILADGGGTLNGIEISLLGVHLAHAVPGGPYKVVDVDNNGSEMVSVDGFGSHTHGVGLDLVSVEWKLQGEVLGNELEMDFVLGVGEHVVSLTVVDSSGNASTSQTLVSVKPFGYPDIAVIAPDTGGVAGGEEIHIIGSGFTYSNEETIVRFAGLQLPNRDYEVVNATHIRVLRTPTVVIARTVDVSVETPLGESDAGDFRYVASVPIQFEEHRLLKLPFVARVKFGPDGWLYAVTTSSRSIAKYELDFQEDGNVTVKSSVLTSIEKWGYTGKRFILGIAFDPMETYNKYDPFQEPPSVYITHSAIFHLEQRNSAGNAINGMVTKVSGANLEVFEDIVTGLPVSDYDHGINGIEFGNNGELFFLLGGNTNGGLPGALSSSKKQKDSFFSSSIMIANLADPDFNGHIQYTAEDDGIPIVDGASPGDENYHGPDVYAYGLRNAFGIVVHSNGKVYTTDNGPNEGYGAMANGCGPGEFIPDKTAFDEVNYIVKDRYYGHPNLLRASHYNDTEQCFYHGPTEPSSGKYRKAIATSPSSSTGIIDYHANHFDGQLRGNLVLVDYKYALRRVVLTPTGEDAVVESGHSIEMSGRHGLDVTMAPNGWLFEARYIKDEIWFQRPVESEETTRVLKINTVFPHRGPTAGGNILSLYGYHFNGSDAAPFVTVGGSECVNAQVVAYDQIDCVLPPGMGLVDVALTKGAEVSTFAAGYRYITGLPPNN